MRVSVCIPTVNRIEYFRESLASVAAQSFTDYEVVVSDNSGDVRYGEAVRRTVCDWPGLQVRIFHQTTTIDAVDNCNFLIEAALGDYWLYLPDDDRLTSECLECLVGALEQSPDIAFAFGDHWIIDADGQIDIPRSQANSRRYGRSRLKEGRVQSDHLYTLALGQAMELQSMLFRREVVRRFKFAHAGGTAPDFDLQMRLAVVQPPLVAYYCSRRVTEYRVHAGQVTAGTPESPVGYQSTIKILESCPPRNPDLVRAFHRRLGREYVGMAVLLARQGNLLEARRALRSGIALDPWRAKAYACAALFHLPRIALLGAAACVSNARNFRAWLRGVFASTTGV